MIQIKEVQVPFEELLKTIQQLNSTELEALIDQVIRLQAQRNAPSLPIDQSLLFQQINQSISPQLQEQYDILVAKRDSETLTSEEYQELLNFSAQIENIEVTRIEHLTELAQLRQTTLTSLIQEFHLQPS
jgi:type II secretory pathway component PulM